MKIVFVCDLPKEHFPFWNDGLKAALDVLRNEYKWEIDIWNQPDIMELGKRRGYDLGLFWGGLTNILCNFRIFPKQALCFGGGPTYHPNIHNFDLIFAESKIDYLDFKRFGLNVVHAFGTNTKLFRPMPEQPKIFDYIYPAAFARWKHHEKFVKYVIDHLDESRVDLSEVNPSLAFGYIQPNGWEKECYEVCQKAGIAIMPWVPYSTMPYLMNASENVYVGADATGGCQRTILEAKACGIPVIVDSDSPKLLELNKLTREEILKDWSEESYAKQLKGGMESICI